MSRFPGARITDMHACPVHGGGPIVTGFPTVLVGKLPASRIGDISMCLGVIPDPLVQGSPTVLIGKSPASRMTDSCAHGGKIVSGCPTVLIGIYGGGAPKLAAGPTAADACMRAAAKSGAPFIVG
ncbi:MAG: PAAR domain-containing protein [Tateyamaria sp.]|uniref:PAAR domain-containing protein n=1 Tax=Tateyamaria sp. TaxID=1929288 RepID=UPI0032A12205